MQHFYKKNCLKVNYTYIMRLLGLFKNCIVHYMFLPSYGHHQYERPTTDHLGWKLLGPKHQTCTNIVFLWYEPLCYELLEELPLNIGVMWPSRGLYTASGNSPGWTLPQDSLTLRRKRPWYDSGPSIYRGRRDHGNIYCAAAPYSTSIGFHAKIMCRHFTQGHFV
jgi:hypothetical protein